MTHSDYIFGHNYIGQLQSLARDRSATVRTWLDQRNIGIIYGSFTWSLTPQGRDVWNDRNHLFETYFHSDILHNKEVFRGYGGYRIIHDSLM